jgi:propanol-preferring alcohol dehydrogenase
MRALQIQAPGPIEDHPLKQIELQTPEVLPGQILIKIDACGMCHTDLHTVEGDLELPVLPITPGHQVVGKIEQLGPSVDEWQVGDRVGVPWLFNACGHCSFCLRGDENLCAEAEFTGLHHNGGYAEYMVAEAKFSLPIPDSMDNIHAAPLLCAGIIGYRSLHKVELQSGERLGLVGFGASAHLVIQIAHYWGNEVYVFTRSKGHRALAEELGAVWVGGIEDHPPQSLDRAILFAPSGQLVPPILERLHPGGTLAINAIHLTPIPELEYRLIYGERTLRTVANATHQDGLEFMQLAAKIPIRVRATEYPLGDVNDALQDLKQSKIDGAGVLQP